MAKRMLIDATHPEETRVAVVDGRRLEEFDVEVASKKLLKGNIYLAKITRVEPSLQAAFVEYGGNRHGFLAFSEIHPDYYRIPVEDREALLAEQAAMAREEDEREEEESQSRHRRSDSRRRGRSDRSGSRGGTTSPEAANEDPAADSLAGPQDEMSSHGSDHDSGHDDSGHDDSGHHDSGPDVSGGEDFAEERSRQDDRGTEEASETTTAPGGESAALRVTGEAENRLSSEPFEAAHEDSHAPDSSADPAEASQSAAAEENGYREVTPAGTADEAPAHHPVIEEAHAPAQPLETIGGDEAEEPSQRRSRPLSRRYKIQDVIKRRQIILVQVTKEERGNKGAALTTYLSLAGRYCVLMPNTDRGGGVSRKITNAGDRKRLKSIIDDLELPDGMAVIVRTAGSERSKPEVKRDFEYLIRLWDEIRELTLRSSASALIYEEANLIKRAIRDLYTRDIEDIQVEGDEAYRAAKSFMRMLMPSHAKRVQQYKDPTMPLFTRYQIESQLDAIHNPVVQLRSGGYIVINQTEALVAIDVNSGRATRERNIEETALKTNLEASDEIARQLRLRDLAGLVVIDYIDMDESRHNGQVERRLKEAMRNDRARIQLGRISPFGLLELSRQRLRPSLFEASTEVCRYCHGTGHVRSTESTALHVLRSIEEEGARQKSAAITVSVPAQVALFILNHKRQSLAELEIRQGFRIYLAADESLVPPEFRIERLKALAPGDAPPAPVIQPSAPPEETEIEVEEPIAAAEAEEEVETVEQPSEERAREARSDEEGGDRRRGRRRRRRGRDRDDTRDHGREGGRDHDRGRRAEAQPDAGGAHASEAAEATGEIGDAQAAPSSPTEGGEGPQGDGGEQGRRRRRRGRRGGRRRRRDGDRGGETNAQASGSAEGEESGSEGNGQWPHSGAESAEAENHGAVNQGADNERSENEGPRGETTEIAAARFEERSSPAEERYQPEERAAERTPPVGERRPAAHRHNEIAPAEPSLPLPELAPQAPAAESHSTPESPLESEEAKSGPRKRGWWQRVLS
jgi:ribonuclease E